MAELITGGAAASEHLQEYLTFSLGTEEYGIDILNVQEIRGYEAVTRIAGAPPYIKGVINLRGAVVPILDLRIKLATGRVEYNALTVVIIVNVGSRVAGVVVDSVSDVIGLAAGDVRPAPELAAGIGAHYVAGLACPDGRTIILADIEKLLAASGMQLADEPLAA